MYFFINKRHEDLVDKPLLDKAYHTAVNKKLHAGIFSKKVETITRFAP